MAVNSCIVCIMQWLMTYVTADGWVFQSATVVTPANDCCRTDLPRDSRLSRPLDGFCSASPAVYMSATHTHTHTRPYGFCMWQPGWAGTRRSIHPLTPIMVISHPLYASSIYYDPWHPPCSIYVHDSIFSQSVLKFSLVYLLAWHPPLHTPYISSTNHCLLFTAHAHIIATCFAVVLRSCHLILVSLSTFTCKSIL